MNRRSLIKALMAAPLFAGFAPGTFALPSASGKPARARSRVRPGDPEWPAADRWDRLKQDVGGRLRRLESPFANCAASGRATCADALAHLKNPYYLGDDPALTQTSGWVDAWTSQPSVYAVVPERTADVVAAVNFAREHRLRLVVKGGGHSYQGTSDSADSLLVWTRKLTDITLHDAFVGEGCAGTQAPQPAVSIGAGAMWVDAYDAVTTRGGRYVQGGGCMTVGVAGLVQSGGFGSFSKRYGMAAAGLIEAEVVTADGQVRIANACTHPDLFWGLKGGGGGSLGVVTRVTLRTRELPGFFGGAFGAISADSDASYRALIAKALQFYASDLFNPHWGEQMVFTRDNTLRIAMVFQGLDPEQAQATWTPFLEWVRAQPGLRFAREVSIVGLPARHLWDAAFLQAHAPGLVVADDRAGASTGHVLWAGDQGQAGQFLHGYQSAWLPASLLGADRRAALVDAVFAATREWEMALHFNKGLAGAPAEEIDAARHTATNPAVLDAFALAIIAAEGAPAFPGMPGPTPNLDAARDAARHTRRAMDALRRVAPDAGAYVSESDYFQPGWQAAFWGANHARLAAVKRAYDPTGLFFVHHGVGSERWSADGFTLRD